MNIVLIFNLITNVGILVYISIRILSKWFYLRISQEFLLEVWFVERYDNYYGIRISSRRIFSLFKRNL